MTSPQAVPHSRLPKGIYHRLRQSFYWRFNVKTTLTVASVFTHYAVLQREAPVNIWGTTDPNEYVEVSFNGQILVTQADKEGTWKVTLAPMAANSQGQRLHIKTFFEMITLHYVVVGEVWVCSGQSNMGWTIELSADADKHIREATNPLIRMLAVPSERANAPQKSLPKCQWAESHPDCTRHWSAVGYHFAQKLYEELGVPIGIIWSALGATKIQEWTSKQINQLHDYEIPEEWNDNQKSSLFNTMIAPLIPYTIKGVAWYQGEENHWGAGLYQTQLSAMIEDWRERWQQGSFPFIYVQLANFSETNSQPWSAWAELQEAQMLSLEHPNTAMAVAIDVGEKDDIHPRRKQPVGERLAIAALGKWYGKLDVFSGPIYKDFHREGSRIRILFDHTGEGLMTSDGLSPNWFEIAEANPIDGKNPLYYPAQAQIQGHSIVVWHESMQNPIAVRYAFNNNPEGCNLNNSVGLPASPFRTHNDWSATLGNNPKRKVKQVPVALHQRYSTQKNTPLRVLAKGIWSRTNSHATENIVVVSEPKLGTLKGEAPFFVYQPHTDSLGVDSFSFYACDETCRSNIATVVIDIENQRTSQILIRQHQEEKETAETIR